MSFHVHGGLVTQKQALQMAKKYCDREWTVYDQAAEPEIRRNMEAVKQGLGGMELLGAYMTIMAAATFGHGHFEAGYSKVDNEWLGVEFMPAGEIEDAIRRLVVEGKWSEKSATTEAETMNDVVEALKSKHSEKHD